jgi:2'-5' RNA ligase
MSPATYHLWVKPTGAVRDTLFQTIRELAHELGGPVFEPHVTLLGGLIGTEQEHTQRTRMVTQQLRPFQIVLSGPSYRTEYFQCLFMHVEETPSLMSANALSGRIFQKPDETYMPHLSLVYGSYPESRKRAIIRTLPPDVHTSFEVTALSLIRADGDDPREWHEITTCPFTG